MGYDPDECPEEITDKALDLENRMGEDALSELIPIYGRKNHLQISRKLLIVTD